MPSLSFYARGDSSTANNASLNAQNTSQVPTTQLTFQSSGGSGDIHLEYNGGAPDPDTVVLIDGTSYSFTVEFSGTLPTTNKLSNVNGVDLRGERVVVITADGQRYFILPDAEASFDTMDAFPNGAHAIGNVDENTDVLICFAGGTRILTPEGPRAVETLQAGAAVTIEGGATARILWIARTFVSAARMRRDPSLCPVRIPRGALGAGLPEQDLWISPQHRLVWQSWQNEMLFGTDTVLVPAGMLVPQLAEACHPEDGIHYYHVLLARHDMLFAEGVATESFQPSRQTLEGLAPDARRDYERTVPAPMRAHVEARPDRFYSLRAYEARLLGGLPYDGAEPVYQPARVAA